MSARARFRRMRQPPEKVATGRDCSASPKPRPASIACARARAW